MTRVKSIVLDAGDDNLSNECIETDDNILQEVMGHRPRRYNFLNFERNGVGFVTPTQILENSGTTGLLSGSRSHIRDRVHHQAADFHFNFQEILLTGSLPANYIILPQNCNDTPIVRAVLNVLPAPHRDARAAHHTCQSSMRASPVKDSTRVISAAVDNQLLDRYW